MAKRRYPNPFGGKPGRIELTRHFLLAPAVLMKVNGLAMSAVWRQLKADSIRKALDYHRDRGQKAPKRLVDRFIQLLPYEEVREEFQYAVDLAEHGDDSEVLRLNAQGEWGSFLRGTWFGKSVEEYPYRSRYLLALEDALAEPSDLIEQGELAAAARAMTRNELTRPLLSPEMAFALAAATSKSRFGLVQLAVTLESALSLLAAWSVDTTSDAHAKDLRDITPLFADEAGTPGQQFYSILIRTLNCSSMGELLDRLSFEGDAFDVRTLQRWSAGETLPESDAVCRITSALCPEEADWFANMHWAMRYLTLLGHVSETVLIAVEKYRFQPGADGVLAPWPTFPFGHGSFPAWCRSRYRFWYEYHQHRLAVESLKDSTASSTGS